MAALDLEARLRRYLISAPPAMRRVVVLAFSHPSMPAVRYVWREAKAGAVRLPTGDSVDVMCLNFTCKLPDENGSLEQEVEIAVDTTDIGDEFREALDMIAMDDDRPVQIVYFEYLSDDLLNVQSSLTLEALSCTYKIGSAVIAASTPKFNVNSTGEVYSPRDVPMLRAFQ